MTHPGKLFGLGRMVRPVREFWIAKLAVCLDPISSPELPGSLMVRFSAGTVSGPPQIDCLCRSLRFCFFQRSIGDQSRMPVSLASTTQVVESLPPPAKLQSSGVQVARFGHKSDPALPRIWCSTRAESDSQTVGYRGQSRGLVGGTIFRCQVALGAITVPPSPRSSGALRAPYYTPTP